MRYVAIIEEVFINRIEFDARDEIEAEFIALNGFKDGKIIDDDPYRDSITILSIDTKEEHDGVVNSDM